MAFLQRPVDRRRHWPIPVRIGGLGQAGGVAASLHRGSGPGVVHGIPSSSSILARMGGECRAAWSNSKSAGGPCGSICGACGTMTSSARSGWSPSAQQLGDLVKEPAHYLSRLGAGRYGSR